MVKKFKTVQECIEAAVGEKYRGEFEGETKKIVMPLKL